MESWGTVKSGRGQLYGIRRGYLDRTPSPRNSRSWIDTPGLGRRAVDGAGPRVTEAWQVIITVPVAVWARALPSPLDSLKRLADLSRPTNSKCHIHHVLLAGPSWVGGPTTRDRLAEGGKASMTRSADSGRPGASAEPARSLVMARCIGQWTRGLLWRMRKASDRLGIEPEKL